MNLGFHDLHMELDRATRRLKMFDTHHRIIFDCEARNRTVANGQYYHNGNCPPGEFLLGPPRACGTIPFGPWFIVILDYGGYQTMAHYNRSGIGIHGGGSGLALPFAPCQGWQITHGCWRLQNEDLDKLARCVSQWASMGGKTFVTVADPGSAAAPSALAEDYTPLATLAPGE